MIKTVLIVAACSIAAFTAGTARTVYTPLQIASPVGYSVKMTLSPDSIWSWHNCIPVSAGETVRTKVLVDIDRNGLMDTIDPNYRVMITDMQVVVTPGPYAAADGTITAILRDTGGFRWSLTPSSGDYAGGGADDRHFLPTSYRMTTPIILPVASDLRVDITNVTGPSGDIGDRTVEVHLVGRVVNL